MLALAADGSGSIDNDELRLQREGYGEALASPEVLSVIARGIHGAIAVIYTEWGGPTSQHVIVDWTLIRDAATARAFATELVTRPGRPAATIRFPPPSTSAFATWRRAAFAPSSG